MNHVRNWDRRRLAQYPAQSASRGSQVCTTKDKGEIGGAISTQRPFIEKGEEEGSHKAPDGTKRTTQSSTQSQELNSSRQPFTEKGEERGSEVTQLQTSVLTKRIAQRKKTTQSLKLLPADLSLTSPLTTHLLVYYQTLL